MKKTLALTLMSLLAACDADTTNNEAVDSGSDQRLADANVPTDAGSDQRTVPDTGRVDRGGEQALADAAPADLDVLDLAPATLYRSSAPLEIPNLDLSAVEPMKVIWGANGDIVWSMDRTQIVAPNGTVKATLVADPLTGGADSGLFPGVGGVTLAFDGTHYYVGYTYWDGVSIVDRNLYAVVATYDAQGAPVASAVEMTSVEGLMHMEAIWNGTTMGFVGVKDWRVGLFETGPTLNSNQTITETTLPAARNQMTSALWDGDAYCIARNGGTIYLACVKGDGTITRANQLIGPSLTSHEVDMAKGADDIFIAYTELASNPPYTYHIAKIAPDGTVTDKTVGSFSDAETYQMNIAIEHDGQHVLLATIEENEAFLTVYDLAFNIVERHPLGPGENIDLALSPTKLVVAHTNFSADRLYDKVILHLFVR